MSLQETLKALSDPTRREILQMLRGGSKSAGGILFLLDKGAKMSFRGRIPAR